MGLKIVGLSYPKIRIASVKYPQIKATDFTLWERHKVQRILDSVESYDYLRADVYVIPRDYVEVYEECLIGDPPFEEKVNVSENIGIYIEYQRFFREEIVPSTSFVYGMDKYLREAVNVGEKFSIRFTQNSVDVAPTKDHLDCYALTEKAMRDTTAPVERIKYTGTTRRKDTVTNTDRLKRQGQKDNFAESVSPTELASWEFSKKIKDAVSITDRLAVSSTRSATATYGMAVFGGSTFGG